MVGTGGNLSGKGAVGGSGGGGRVGGRRVTGGRREILLDCDNGRESTT